MTNELSIILAQSTAAGQSGYLNIIFILGIVVVFYFFMIRPQMKRSKDQKKFKESLQKGQKIITIGGIHGRIVEIQDTTVTIEVENNVRLRVEKTAIAMDSTQTIEQPQS
ncbi:MAG TPA: preprotein translocase subunit YajC [Bacteroidales bacterium]|nr:preprotein translocase subunit YajC [Bacteroidales bacterium]HPS62471.1 preprotein translocase subunit YajC [Bacteroidales bacterium]